MAVPGTESSGRAARSSAVVLLAIVSVVGFLLAVILQLGLGIIRRFCALHTVRHMADAQLC